MGFRVPDGMTPPTRSGSNLLTNLSLPFDGDGFFGRECPNPDCLAYFKLALDEYKLARERHMLTCPNSGTTESDEHFLAKDQVQRIRAAQVELVRGAVNDILRDMGRRGSARSGSVTITCNAPAPYQPSSTTAASPTRSTWPRQGTARQEGGCASQRPS